MAQERNGAATVIEQQGARVRVEYQGERIMVPMVGFPPTFKLRPGERVILVDQPSGPIARPLVRAISSRIPQQALERGREFEIEGQRLVIQESTVVYEPEPSKEQRPTEEHVLWFVDPGEAEGPNQVIAIRRSR